MLNLAIKFFLVLKNLHIFIHVKNNFLSDPIGASLGKLSGEKLL
jgi:hypothetical protein